MKWFFLITGIALGCYGLVAGVKEKDDALQRKIYYIFGGIGIVIAAISAFVLFS